MKRIFFVSISVSPAGGLLGGAAPPAANVSNAYACVAFNDATSEANASV